MTKNNRIMASALAICLTALACSLPSGAATEAPVGNETPSITPSALETGSPTPTLIAATVACGPQVTTITDSNVRSGPGQVYNIYGVIPQGGTAPVAGKNLDGSWWFIEFAAGDKEHGWISASITTATCIPATLAVIADPPTPTVTPSNTPTLTLTPSATPTLTPTPTITPSPTPYLPVFTPFDFPCLPFSGC